MEIGATYPNEDLILSLSKGEVRALPFFPIRRIWEHPVYSDGMAVAPSAN
jgi:hypothetical protein